MFDALSILVAKRCAFCRVPAKKNVCDECFEKLSRIEGRTNGQPLAPFIYQGEIRDALRRYKFRGMSWISKVFARFMAETYKKAGIDCDVVTWVPCSFRRSWRRGYDQSKLLAKSLARELELPIMGLLSKKGGVPSQVALKSDEARRKNVKGAFRAKREIAARKILLIDDIYTSGATTEECKAQLLKAGAREVVVMVVAVRGGESV